MSRGIRQRRNDAISRARAVARAARESREVGSSAPVGGGSGVSRYRIPSGATIADDWYEAATWDGTTEGASAVAIAKPEILRGATEPVFAVGLEVWTTRPAGGTGVVDASGNAVPLLDVSTSAVPPASDQYKVLQMQDDGAGRMIPVWDWPRFHE